MKRYNTKKLYETVIKKLLATRFYKGETPYIFAYYTYEKGIYDFYFAPEKDKDKEPYYIGVTIIINRLYWQHIDDYTETYQRNCDTFDKCESITA